MYWYKNLRNAGYILLLLCAVWMVAVDVQAQNSDEPSARMQRKLENELRKQLKNSDVIFSHLKHLGKIKADSAGIDIENKIIRIHLSPAFTHLPVRQQLIDEIAGQYAKYIDEQFEDYTLHLYSRGAKAETFIPPFFNSGKAVYGTARAVAAKCKYPVVQRQSLFPKGLSGRHIALWQSHGLYYEAKLDRWEWQRAGLFQTVEDLLTMSFAIPYLVPMLENAGANVFIPRERDVQPREVIIDGNGSTGNSEIIVVNDGSNRWQLAKGGFAAKDTLFDNENPFAKGSHYTVQSARATNARLFYVPDIAESGNYSVYVSWAQHADAIEDVDCTVSHAGGADHFGLNQKMAAGTWIYLGTYYFNKGKDFYGGRIEISAQNSTKGTVSIDAVRFGGGMGNVARSAGDTVVQRLLSAKSDTVPPLYKKNWQLSGKPRYMEAARYYLQYAGMPDTAVYSHNKGMDDYRDDITARGEWVNYLTGAVHPADSLQTKGLGIPVDLSFAFHTDAGVTQCDSVVGTLAIYSSGRNNGSFTDGTSKLKSRDLADIVQTQIVDDVCMLYNKKWTRRAMWDKLYSEAWRPNTPAMLLELLSHQNMADMRYGLLPQFRFDVSRAIYKGIVRYLEGSDAIVQPLPPTHLAIERKEGKTVRITWKPASDPLEPSAEAASYKVYIRKENKGFGSGILCDEPVLELELDEWQTCYDVKVTAVNDGGESFATETLSVALLPANCPAVLIVNAFTRTSAPPFFTADSTAAGIAWWNEHGVPAGIDYGMTGFQYDFDRRSAWLDDDSPGFGASHADMEGKPVRGNTFDFAATHGKAFRNAGYSFVSVSRDAFENRHFDASGYKAVDIIFGEERGTSSYKQPECKQFRVFSDGMIDAIERVIKAEGNILVSGAYIGTDGVENRDEKAIAFAKKSLGFAWRTNHADNRGEVKPTAEAASLFPALISYNAGYRSDCYTVESPDAIEPDGEKSVRIFRYAGNSRSAGVAFTGKKHKAVTLGFPIETVIDKEQLNGLVKGCMVFFEEEQMQ
ncbi:MAG: hypothetical protein LBV41_03415 [Cytophagaceae bacterium]|nr:hypothetical protein [Cytophagaceae bacterium]